MMDESKEFARMKIVWSRSVADTERRAAESSKDKLVVIEMPITALVPHAKNPSTSIRCYAHGEVFAELMERTRSELTTRLIKHLPTLRLSP